MEAARLGRRRFLRDAGRTAVGLVVVTALPACTAGGAGAGAGRASASPGAPATPAGAATPGGGSEPTAAAVDWHRVDLEFVSAYVLMRDDEAAVVDTGVAGSDADIAAALEGLGLLWDDVGHVILTHHHADHVGSAAAVLERATGATAYAGAGDAEVIDVPRPLTVVGDGDTVFGLRIITTPGHTPGHISVLDEAGGLLVAGDALVGGGETVEGPDPQYTEDMATAGASVRKLAGYTFDTAVFGHGEPVSDGADAAVADLAARLQQAPSAAPPTGPATS